MMRWTGKIKPAMDRQTLVSSIDLAPTILSAAGTNKTDAMTGMNLLDVAAGKSLDRDAIFGEIYAHDIADINQPSKSLLYRWCISGDNKLILSYDGQAGRHGAIHQYLRGSGKPRLFDITNDPFEKTDLFSDRSDLADKLESKVNAFFSRF